MPVSMNHHQYYPWTYVLPDGRLFIAGPHDPASLRRGSAGCSGDLLDDLRQPQHGAEKGTSVLCILRPPDYRPVVFIMGGNTPSTERRRRRSISPVAVPAWSAHLTSTFRAPTSSRPLLPTGACSSPVV